MSRTQAEARRFGLDRTPPAAARVALALYRSLLPVLPLRVRRRYATEMLVLFTDLAADARERAGRRGLWTFTAGACARLIGAGLAERRRAVRAAARGRRAEPPDRNPFRGLAHDLRHGVRALFQSPGYVAIVVLTLGLATGASTTIFSMVWLVVVPPDPHAEPERLVVPFGSDADLTRQQLSAVEVEALRELQTLESVSAFRISRALHTIDGVPEHPIVLDLTPEYLDTIGVPVALGRGFARHEGRPGAEPVVILTHGAWQTRFAGSVDAVGRMVLLDRVAHTVVGVLPESLIIGPFRVASFLRPLTIDPAEPADRRDLWTIARLAPGVSLAAAEAEVEASTARIRERHPATHASWELRLQLLHDTLSGSNAWVVLTMMSIAVLFVLLIACVNVANLTLSRAVRRRREISVRIALGARRGRVVRQMLTESLLVSVLAAAVGLVMARAIFAALVWLASRQVPLFEMLTIDRDVLVFATALAALTPLLFGTWPALRASRTEPADALREGGRGGASRREARVRRLLVIAQVALAMGLLAPASLAARTVAALFDIELGFAPERVLTFYLELPEPPGRAPFLASLRERILDEPLVEDAGLTSHRPLLGNEPRPRVEIEGASAPDEANRAARVAVDPGFFDTLAIPVVAGRSVADTDTAASAGVAVVNRTAARRFWPDGDPVGARVRLAGDDWRQVVGIVGDVRNADADQPPAPHVYVPIAQSELDRVEVVVRTRSEPGEALAPLRRTLARLDPGVPIDDVRTMEQIHYDDLASDLAIIGLLVFFAGVALALAIAGLYGVIAYGVSQRAREIGIRMAVGARRRDIARLVTRQGATTVALGVVLGLLLAFAIARLIAGNLYGVGPNDPLTFIGLPLVLMGVGVLASALPARRAARLDPGSTLRAD